MKPESPGLTVDLIIIKPLIDQVKEILLVKRANEPFGWALPGGFVNIGETVKKAVLRECVEETGLVFFDNELMFFGEYSSPDRDPRGHNVSLVYYADPYMDSLKEKFSTLKAGDDAAEVQFFSLLELPQMAFDHKKIIHDYILAHGV